jgi:hypothetical protein
MRLGVRAAMVVASRQLRDQVIVLGARWQHVAMRAPHPVDRGDDRGGIVSRGADPEESDVADRPRALEHQRRTNAVDLSMLRYRDPGDLGTKVLQFRYGSQDALGDRRLDRFGEAFLEDADAQPFHPAIQIQQHVHPPRDATVLTGIIFAVAGHCLQCGRHVAPCAPSALRDPRSAQRSSTSHRSWASSPVRRVTPIIPPQRRLCATIPRQRRAVTDLREFRWSPG